MHLIRSRKSIADAADKHLVGFSITTIGRRVLLFISFFQQPSLAFLRLEEASWFPGFKDRKSFLVFSFHDSERVLMNCLYKINFIGVNFEMKRGKTFGFQVLGKI